MTSTLTQFTITGPATGYWRVTFSNPPIHLIGPDTILELQPARRSMNESQILYVLVDMQNLKRSERVQPLDRRPRRVPSRGALAAVLFGVVVLAAFGHITAFLLFLLAGIAVLAAVLRRRRSGR